MPDAFPQQHTGRALDQEGAQGLRPRQHRPVGFVRPRGNDHHHGGARERDEALCLIEVPLDGREDHRLIFVANEHELGRAVDVIGQLPRPKPVAMKRGRRILLADELAEGREIFVASRFDWYANGPGHCRRS